MAEKPGTGRKRSGLECDLGAGNGKPALVAQAQPGRLPVGGAPLPSRGMTLLGDDEHLAHSMRVLDILERIDRDQRAAKEATRKAS